MFLLWHLIQTEIHSPKPTMASHVSCTALFYHCYSVFSLPLKMEQNTKLIFGSWVLVGYIYIWHENVFKNGL